MSVLDSGIVVPSLNRLKLHLMQQEHAHIPSMSPMIVSASPVPATPSRSENDPAIKRHKSTMECAVSLRFLKAFALNKVQDGMTTEGVQGIVKEATEGYNCRYVEAPGAVPDADVGPPTYFASHEWRG